MAFLLIMVATGWVWSEHMTEERVHFPERERESSKEKLREAEETLKRALREGVLVFILGLLGTSQWLS